jgi:hypothetical protein
MIRLEILRRGLDNNMGTPPAVEKCPRFAIPRPHPGEAWTKTSPDRTTPAHPSPHQPNRLTSVGKTGGRFLRADHHRTGRAPGPSATTRPPAPRPMTRPVGDHPPMGAPQHGPDDGWTRARRPGPPAGIAPRSRKVSTLRGPPTPTRRSVDKNQPGPDHSGPPLATPAKPPEKRGPNRRPSPPGRPPPSSLRPARPARPDLSPRPRRPRQRPAAPPPPPPPPPRRPQPTAPLNTPPAPPDRPADHAPALRAPPGPARARTPGSPGRAPAPHSAPPAERLFPAR